MKFSDLCLILDFTYTGQAQVPHDRLEDFLKMGELLQIRGIKEGRIHYMTNLQVQTVQQTSATTTTFNNRSFDSTITSTQEFTVEPSLKRPREDDEITVQEASEFMMKLIESNTDIDVEVAQVKTLTANTSSHIQNHVTRSAVQSSNSLVNSESNILKKSVAVNQKAKYFCKFCWRSMVAQGRMNKHEIECDENPNRIIAECEYCGLKVKPTALSTHLKKHGITKSSMLDTALLQSPPMKTSIPAKILQKLNDSNGSISPNITGSQSPSIISSPTTQLKAADSTLISPDASQVVCKQPKSEIKKSIEQLQEKDQLQDPLSENKTEISD